MFSWALDWPGQLPPFITHGMAIISWLSALPLFANSIF
jgi:hypothetical protein